MSSEAILTESMCCSEHVNESNPQVTKNEIADRKNKYLIH